MFFNGIMWFPWMNTGDEIERFFSRRGQTRRIFNPQSAFVHIRTSNPLTLLCFFVILERLGFKNIMQFPRCALRTNTEFHFILEKEFVHAKAIMFFMQNYHMALKDFRSLIASVHIERTICNISSFQEESHTGLK